MANDPVLSICIPTYHRPELFERALRSAMTTRGPIDRVELIVSDNSTEDDTEAVAHRLLSGWSGRARYVRNRPGVGAEPNFNRCIELSTGRFVLILHDDDYLLPQGVDRILRAIDRAAERDRVLLFGVHVVDENERLRRRQRHRKDRRLSPGTALAKVLTNSSYVRFPAIVVRRDAYEEVGPFDVSVANPTDLEMWTRLFSRYGVSCVSSVTAAYTVHGGALTSEMFRPETFANLDVVFDRAVEMAVLPEHEVRRHQADFFAQFILAATFRRLQARDLAGARQTLAFFDLPRVRRLGPSVRWLPVRLAFRTATVGVGRG
jgi:glycosyltransferase involved in cell wall biosynthesis